MAALVFGLAVAFAAPASALSAAMSLRITDIYTDSFGTGLGPGSQIPVEFTANGCELGDDSCFDYYGGDPVTGGYYYDFPFFVSVDIGAEVLIGSFFGPEDYGDTTIRNRARGAGGDAFAFSAWTDGAVALPDTLDDLGARRGHITLDIALADADGTVFTHGGVPASLPPLEEFESSSFYVYMYYGSQAFEAMGVVQGVPEPGSLALIGAGIAVALASGRRRAS